MALAPGTAVGLVPWWLTGWHAGQWWLPVRMLGGVLVASGGAVLVDAFARFVVEGLGTPAPVAPPERLVVGGLYRHVRNPMYLAVETAIIGQALLLGRPVLLVYGVITGGGAVGGDGGLAGEGFGCFAGGVGVAGLDYLVDE